MDSPDVDLESAAIDALSKRMDAMLQRMQAALERMNGAPEPIASASSSPTSPATATTTSSTSLNTPVSSTTPPPTIATATSSIDASTLGFPITVEPQQAPPARCSTPSLNHDSKSSATPSPATSASRSPPASSSTPSSASTSIDTTMLGSTTTREPLQALTARCSTPGRSHCEHALASVIAAPASPSTLTATSAYAALSSSAVTMGATADKLSVTSEGALLVFDEMPNRYTISASSNHSVGVVLLCSAVEVHEAQEVFEAMTIQSALMIWLSFISNLEVVQARQTWPPPIHTFQLVYPSAIGVFDCGKSRIDVQNPGMLELVHPTLVDKGLQKSILNVVQIGIRPKPPWALVCSDAANSRDDVTSQITWMLWSYLLKDCITSLTGCVQLMPIPWPSFTSHTRVVCSTVKQHMVNLLFGDSGSKCLQSWLEWNGTAVRVDRRKDNSLSQFSVGCVHLQKMWGIPWQLSQMVCWLGEELMVIIGMQILWQCYTSEVKVSIFSENISQALTVRWSSGLNISLELFVSCHTSQGIWLIQEEGVNVSDHTTLVKCSAKCKQHFFTTVAEVAPAPMFWFSGTINSVKLQISYGGHRVFDRGKCTSSALFLSTMGTVSHGQVGIPAKPPWLQCNSSDGLTVCRSCCSENCPCFIIWSPFTYGWALVQQSPPWPPYVQLDKLLPMVLYFSAWNYRMKLLNGGIELVLRGHTHANWRWLLVWFQYLSDGAFSWPHIQLHDDSFANGKMIGSSFSFWQPAVVSMIWPPSVWAWISPLQQFNNLIGPQHSWQELLLNGVPYSPIKLMARLLTLNTSDWVPDTMTAFLWRVGIHDHDWQYATLWKESAEDFQLGAIFWRGCFTCSDSSLQVSGSEPSGDLFKSIMIGNSNKNSQVKYSDVWTSTMENQQRQGMENTPWDPGGCDSGLRARRVSKGEECHGLGYHMGPIGPEMKTVLLSIQKERGTE